MTARGRHHSDSGPPYTVGLVVDPQRGPTGGVSGTTSSMRAAVIADVTEAFALLDGVVKAPRLAWSAA